MNLTNHSYFNLGGHDSADKILTHSLQIFASAYTKLDSDSIPTKEIVDLNTHKAMSFREEKGILEGLKELAKEKGYTED